MKPKRIVYKAERFKDLKEMFLNSAKIYAENTAFIIKNKIDKQIKYTKIKYREFKDDSDRLRNSINRFRA